MMRAYEVEMNIVLSKTMRVFAESAVKAEELARATLLNTDAITFTEQDIAEFDITAFPYTGEATERKSPIVCGCTCCDDCRCCEEEDDEADAPRPVSANGKPMGLDELMLHLSMYLEDAEDELDDVRDMLSAIERYGRAILQVKGEEAKKKSAKEDADI